MTVTVSTRSQLQGVLRALRHSRGLTQAELGRRVGVSQRRIAAIEAAPGRTSFDQMTKIFLNMGSQLCVREQPTGEEKPSPRPKKAKKLSQSELANW